MPSQAALERGSAVAQGIIDSHKQANAGAYPETVAVRAAAALQRFMLYERAAVCMPMWRSSLGGKLAWICLYTHVLPDMA